MPTRPTAPQSITLPASRNWWGVAFGNNTFVATPNASASAAYSTDLGATWTGSALPTAAGALGLGFGNGKFVGVPYGGSVASVSSDNGATWGSATLPLSSNWIGLATDGAGTWIATQQANSSTVVARSTNDGSTWGSANLPAGATVGCFAAYGNGVYVTSSSTVSYRSTDGGATWSAGGTIGDVGRWQAMAYGNGVFCTAEFGPSRYSGYSTDDGVSWTINSTGMPTSANWNAITFGGGIFIAWADGTASAWSADGKTWSVLTAPSGGTWHNGAYGNGVVLGVSGTSTVGTRIGITLTPRTSVRLQATNRAAVF